jgi:hypothetical protein
MRLLKINNPLKHLSLKLFILTPIVSAMAILGAFVIPAAADNIAQGFTAKGNLSPGMVVALSKNTQDTVEAAPASDTSRIYGVVIDPSDAPLILNRQSGDQAFVATAGSYPVLVSTERGVIKSGDYLSISATDGIAAEATYQQSAVLGQAAAGFDGKKGVITTIGSSAIGKITVNVNPHKNPLVRNDISIPPFLRKVGETLAGKPVSAIHIYLALGFLVAAVVIATALLTSGVRGAMIALGRNPLNKGSIMNSMFKVVIAAVMVFVIGLFGVYLLLRI